jgi:hypothetical protein
MITENLFHKPLSLITRQLLLLLDNALTFQAIYLLE